MKNNFFQIRPYHVIKTIAYTLYAVILICISSSVLPAAGYTGAVPDLILCASLAIAYFEGNRTGAVFGTAAGFAAEAVGSLGFSVLPLFYMLCAAFGALLFSRALQKNFAAYMLYTAAFMLVRSAISVIYIQFSLPDYSLDIAIENVLLDEYALTLVCAVPIFFISMGISKILNAGGDTAEVKM